MLLVDVLDSGDDVFRLALRERDGSGAAAVHRAIALQFRHSVELLHVLRLHSSRADGLSFLDSLGCGRDEVGRSSA